MAAAVVLDVLNAGLFINILYYIIYYILYYINTYYIVNIRWLPLSSRMDLPNAENYLWENFALSGLCQYKTTVAINDNNLPNQK